MLIVTTVPPAVPLSSPCPSGRTLALCVALCVLLVTLCAAVRYYRRLVHSERSVRLVECMAEEEMRRQRVHRLLLSLFPAHVAERIKDIDKMEIITQQPIAERFADVSIIFADIVSFTELSSSLVSPTELVLLLNLIFSRFDQLAERHHIEKIKTMGDCYMCVAGVPYAQADHAQMAADMALDMLDAMHDFTMPDGQPLQLRIGINSGPVIAGVIGISKWIYDMWGDAVNTASRMESYGVPGYIQVSADTYRILNDSKQGYVFEDRGILSIKGKGYIRCYILKYKEELPAQRSGEAIALTAAEAAAHREVMPVRPLLSTLRPFPFIDPPVRNTSTPTVHAPQCPQPLSITTTTDTAADRDRQLKFGPLPNHTTATTLHGTARGGSSRSRVVTTGHMIPVKATLIAPGCIPPAAAVADGSLSSVLPSPSTATAAIAIAMPTIATTAVPAVASSSSSSASSSTAAFSITKPKRRSSNPVSLLPANRRSSHNTPFRSPVLKSKKDITNSQRFKSSKDTMATPPRTIRKPTEQSSVGAIVPVHRVESRSTLLKQVQQRRIQQLQEQQLQPAAVSAHSPPAAATALAGAASASSPPLLSAAAAGSSSSSLPPPILQLHTSSPPSQCSQQPSQQQSQQPSSPERVIMPTLSLDGDSQLQLLLPPPPPLPLPTSQQVNEPPTQNPPHPALTIDTSTPSVSPLLPSSTPSSSRTPTNSVGGDVADSSSSLPLHLPSPVSSTRGEEEETASERGGGGESEQQQQQESEVDEGGSRYGEEETETSTPPTGSSTAPFTPLLGANPFVSIARGALLHEEAVLAADREERVERARRRSGGRPQAARRAVQAMAGAAAAAAGQKEEELVGDGQKQQIGNGHTAITNGNTAAALPIPATSITTGNGQAVSDSDSDSDADADEEEEVEEEKEEETNEERQADGQKEPEASDSREGGGGQEGDREEACSSSGDEPHSHHLSPRRIGSRLQQQLPSPPQLQLSSPPAPPQPRSLNQRALSSAASSSSSSVSSSSSSSSSQPASAAPPPPASRGLPGLQRSASAVGSSQSQSSQSQSQSQRFTGKKDQEIEAMCARLAQAALAARDRDEREFEAED